MVDPSDRPRFPANLAVHDVAVLVVGGGQVALRKARELVECGADVSVLAADVDEALAALPGVTVQRRRYEDGDATGYRLVVAATDDAALNRRIAEDTAAGGGWANDATRADGGAMAFPARLRRGRVLVTVSTGGASPGLAAWLRDELAERVGPEMGVLADLVAEARQGRRRNRGSAESGSPGDALPDWREALDSGMLDLIRQGRILEAKERLQACQSSS